MHSWVFRNRARLKAIFGPPPTSAAESATPEQPKRARRRLTRTRVVREDEGTVDRGTRHVLLRPMPPPQS